MREPSDSFNTIGKSLHGPNGGSRKVYVLGAGITGLVVGWKLAEYGWETTIIEKEDIIGGIACSIPWKEFRVDFGPHIFHTVNPDLEKFWEKEFGDLFVKGDFYCKNVKGEKFDQFYDYPLSRESISKYPPDLREAITHELSGVDPQAKAGSKSYSQYVTALVGPTLQQMFFEDYPKKLWGIRAEDMTANWAPKRIELREKATPFYTGRWCAVGRHGTGEILNRMRERFQKAGGKIILGNGVAWIQTQGDRITRLTLADGTKIEITCRDIVVSTIPIGQLAPLLNVPSDLTYRGVIMVIAAFNKDYILPEGIHFLYYDSPSVHFHRVSEQKRFSSAGFPEHKTFLACEIAYSPGDKMDCMPEGELARQVMEQLQWVGLAHPKDCEDWLVIKRPCVYPMQTKDFEHRLKAVQSQLLQYRALYTVGGAAQFVYSDIHINFLKAMDLAGLLINKYSDFYRVKPKGVITKPKKVVMLKNIPVGDGHSPVIIAEAGLNHNGSVSLAMRLIDEAKKAGCQAVKFQTYRAGARVSGRIKKANYAEELVGLEENVLQMFAKFELSWEDHQKIFDYGRRQGIEIFSSVFDEGCVDMLEQLEIPFYKIASCDLVNIPLLRKVASTGKPMIVSTGMSTMGEVEEAVEAILEEGNDNVVLLHCVSSYPADPRDLNLRVIHTLKANFDLPVGFSDHCLGLFASHAALVLGANVIERHFTLDRTLEGPDHVFSSEPSQMAELVRDAAMIDAMLGAGTKRIQQCEYDAVNTFKKTLYAKVPIRQGEVIARDKIVLKGPGGGLSPKYLDVIVGRVARKDIGADLPIGWEDV